MSEIMIDRAVELAARHLAAITRAEAVVLYGSRARGDHGPDSDWDLCVVLPDDVEPQRFTAATLWREASGFGIPIQVYPLRRSIFIERSADLNSISHDVLAEGVPLVGDLHFVTATRASP